MPTGGRTKRGLFVIPRKQDMFGVRRTPDRFGRKRFVNPLATFGQVLGTKTKKKKKGKGVKRHGFF